MFDLGEVGKLIIIIGVVIVGLGALLVLFQNVPFIGKLPGDLSIQRGGFSCFVPIATSIVLSIVLTIILNLVLRLLNR